MAGEETKWQDARGKLDWYNHNKPAGATKKDSSGQWVNDFGPVGGPPPPDPGPKPAVKAATDKRKGKGKKKGKRRRKEPEIHFDEQAFLMDSINLIKNEEQGHGPFGTPYLYKHFLQIEDDQPNVSMNKLTGMGLDALNDITSAQMSGLVPHLRLFKQVKSEGKTTSTEFPFDKFTTMSDILDSREGRGTSAGIVSIDWKDTGGDPGRQGLSFRGKIKLHFQSIEAIFQKMEINGQVISYSDLLEMKGSSRCFDPAKILGKSSACPGDKDEKSKDPEMEKPERQVEVKMACTEDETNIVLEAGWSIANEEILNLSANNLDEELQLMRRRYILIVEKFEIIVTENGDIDLDITFGAGIEGRAMSTQSDILNIDVNNLKNNSPDVSKKLMLMEQQQKDLGKNVQAEQLLLKKQSEKKTSSNEKKIKKLREQREALEKTLNTRRSEIDLMAYRKVLAHIRSSSENKGINGVSNRIFYFDLAPELIKLYTDLIKLNTKKLTFPEKITNEEEKRIIKDHQEDLMQKRKEVARQHRGMGSKATGMLWSDAWVKAAMDKNTVKKNKKLTEGKNPKLMETAQGYVEKVDGDLRIQYMFLGDIVEAVMSLIYEPRNLEGIKLGAKGERCKFTRTGIKVMMGAFIFVDPMNPDKEKSISLADVPVSLNYFNAWWYDAVVGKKKNNYMLLNFLGDLCGKLINNLTSPQRFGGNPGPALHFRSTPLVLREGNPIDNEWNQPSWKRKERIKLNDLLPGGRHSRTKGKQNKYTEWLYVYAVGSPKVIRSKAAWQPLGYADKDIDVNIPHFMIGANTGMLKNANFKRTNLQYQTEVALAKSAKGNESKQVRGNLIWQNVYNADLKLFGHPAFKIGQWIYLDPRSMGISAEDSTGQINIGGYYSITQINNISGPAMFETSLKCIQQVGLRQVRSLRRQLAGRVRR